MESDNQHQELEHNEESPKKQVADFEEPASITWLKEQYNYFEAITTKDRSDNIWLIALKFLLKGIMILILIILSPFILFIIIFSLLVAG